jgi:hypothetical protein
MIRVQAVERTERIFVHSELSRPPNPGRDPAAGRGATWTGDVVVIGCSLRPP